MRALKQILDAGYELDKRNISPFAQLVARGVTIQQCADGSIVISPSAGDE